jgi:hypothetical protein
MTCKVALDFGPVTSEGTVECNSPSDSKGLELKGTCVGYATRNRQIMDRQDKRNFNLRSTQKKNSFRYRRTYRAHVINTGIVFSTCVVRMRTNTVQSHLLTLLVLSWSAHDITSSLIQVLNKYSGRRGEALILTLCGLDGILDSVNVKQA